MMTFSEVHDWQGDSAVKQILVFPSGQAETKFKESFAVIVSAEGIEDASDTGLGAVYKLRAVKDGNGQYIPVVRCGVTGYTLWEDVIPCHEYKTALLIALNTMTKHFLSAASHGALVSKLVSKD